MAWTKKVLSLVECQQCLSFMMENATSETFLDAELHTVAGSLSSNSDYRSIADDESEQTQSKTCFNEIPSNCGLHECKLKLPVKRDDVTVEEIGDCKDKKYLQVLAKLQESHRNLIHFLNETVHHNRKIAGKADLCTEIPDASLIYEYGDTNRQEIYRKIYSAVNHSTPNVLNVYQKAERDYLTMDISPPPPYNDLGYTNRDVRYASVNQLNENINNRHTGRWTGQNDIIVNKKIGCQFVRKLYIILILQLFYTFKFIALCLLLENVRKFIIEYSNIFFFVSSFMYCISSVIIFCSDKARTTFPLNFFLLLIFTKALAMLLATLSCFCNTYILMPAFGVLALICTFTTCIASAPCTDLNAYGIYFLLSYIICGMYGIITFVIKYLLDIDVIFLVYSCLLTILIHFFLLYDTQSILKSRLKSVRVHGRYEVSFKEYITEALTLYTDVFTPFVCIIFISRRKF